MREVSGELEKSDAGAKARLASICRNQKDAFLKQWVLSR